MAGMSMPGRTVAEVGMPARRLRALGGSAVELEGNAAAEHPGWVARCELVQPLPHRYERVVFRRIDGTQAS